MSVKVTVNTGDLTSRAEAAAKLAMKEVMNELNSAFEQSFTAEAWNWPRKTVRGIDGETVREKLANIKAGKGTVFGSPRNLIDKATLRAAHSWDMTGPYQAQFVWWAPHAKITHDGGWIWAWGRRPPRKGARSVYLPPRPWTRAVLGQEQVAAIRPFPLQKRLKDVWLVYFRRSA